MSHPLLFVGAGPGDPDLLTRRAARAIETAEVLLHDRLVSDEVLALAGPQVRRVEVGKTGFRASMAQDDIDARMIAELRTGAQVVRLKSGDPVIFGRLDEEIAALEAAGFAYEIVPGITAASAAAAALGQSLTRRGRNSDLRILTGHDMVGFADHNWRALAREGQVAAIYMGHRAGRYLQGRLLMHGAAPETPMSAVANASRPDQRIVATTLGQLSQDLDAAALSGPVLTFYGLAPRVAAAHPLLQEERA